MALLGNNIILFCYCDKCDVLQGETIELFTFSNTFMWQRGLNFEHVSSV